MDKLDVRSVLEISDKISSAWVTKTLQCVLTDSYDKQLFVDVELRVEGRTFKAHKCILALYSPLLQKVFYGTKTPLPAYIMKGVTPRGTAILLRFLYTSTIPVLALSHSVVDACAAAEILQMTGIRKKLMDYIFSNNTEWRVSNKPLAEKKFWSLLQRSHLLKLKELEEKLLEFAEKRINSVLYHEDFSKANSQIVKLVLNLKTISDSIKLERIAHWKDSNNILNIPDPGVQDLLTCVNFEGLTPKQFSVIASKHGDLISTADALHILMHLVDPTVSPLPKWCSVDDKSIKLWADATLNEAAVNFDQWSKSDKFKSLPSLDKTGNYNLTRDGKLSDFQSQEDVRKLDYSKGARECRDSQSNVEARLHSLPESFCHMLKEGLFTDVTISSKDGTKMPAHRLILALRSEYFAVMLYGAKPVNSVRLDESADEVKTMLKYFYGTGEKLSLKKGPDPINSVLKQLDVAMKYECYPLIQECLNVLHSTPVSTGIFWKLLDQVNQTRSFKVNTERLMKFAVISPKEIFLPPVFYSASKNSLINILESEYLIRSECDILDYLAKWLKANSKDFPTDLSRKELFKYIRFEAITSEQFFSFLKQHDELLLKDDAFAILTFLFRESKESSLPVWCYKGPLRSLYYGSTTKIGSGVLIPWKTSPEMGKNCFECTYTVTISNKFVESQVQFLELSWKISPNRRGEHMKHKCSITIKAEGYEHLIFNDVDVLQNHRIIVPVFFTLSDQAPKIRFHIRVNTLEFYKYYFIKGQKRVTFQNVVMESTSVNNCVSDAIVDNCTSQRIQIPKYLLPSRSNEVLPTEKCFKVVIPKAKD